MPEHYLTAPDYDPQDAGNKPGDGPLRVGGRPPPDDIIKEADNLPSTFSGAARRQMPALGKVRDLFAGTEAIKAKTTTYLPLNMGEDATNYDNRLLRAFFFNAFRRTVEGLIGLVFSTDPILGEDVPPQIVEHWENIDLEGTHGDVFLRERFTDAMTAGHGAILIEYPITRMIPEEEGARPEIEGEIRPYWVPILKDNIVSWRMTEEEGRRVLTQVVLREVVEEPHGAFGEIETTQYRVFFRLPLTENGATVGYKVFRITKDKKLIEWDAGWYPTQDEIPIVEIPTSGRRDLFDSDPPLIDVADLNVAHYQQQSDFDWSKHKTCTPIFVISGIEPPTDKLGNTLPVNLGPNDALILSNPQASASFESHSGQSLEQCRQSLEDLKSDMGTLGLAMLAPQKRVAETAEAKRLDKATSDSSLSVSARGLQDAVERALLFHAKYLNLDSGGSIEINRDFEQVAMDASVMTAYATLIKAGFPLDEALLMLQRGGRIREDADLEDLALAMAAEAAAREADLQEQLALMAEGEED